eukprot:GHRR01018311.1.p1 GENE.GHRR01018311.1~~GHRR01018311.1.p1  ORF type:complete len:407 (+),score=234.92 GHRR01018311.1:156-1223(+)
MVADAAQRLADVLNKEPLLAGELRQVVQQLCAALHTQQQAAAGAVAAQQQQHQTPAGAQPPVVVSQQLVAHTIAALADAQEWTALGRLQTVQPLQSLASYPSLLSQLADAHQYALLRQTVLAAQDIPAGALVQAMQHMLLPQQADSAARQQDSQHMRAAAEAAIHNAEQAAAAGDPATASAVLELARHAAAAVDGFTVSERLLHALLVAPVDAVEAQAAVKQLPTPAVLKLLKYLDKWVAVYSNQPRLMDNSSVQQQQQDGLQALLAIPSWTQVLEWARLVLDAHLTRLAMLPAAVSLLQRLQHMLQQEVSSTSRLVQMKGVADHLMLGAPLPMVAEVASSEYTLELLDLRVASK